MRGAALTCARTDEDVGYTHDLLGPVSETETTTTAGVPGDTLVTSYIRDPQGEVLGYSRFTQLDPVFGDTVGPITLNRYRYASGDPINRVDPDREGRHLFASELSPPNWTGSTTSGLLAGARTFGYAATKTITGAAAAVGAVSGAAIAAGSVPAVGAIGLFAAAGFVAWSSCS